MKHCNLKAIYLLIYQVNTSVHEMLAKKVDFFAQTKFCRHTVHSLDLIKALNL